MSYVKSGMKMAVVGNGPSAAGKGSLIDAHDYVVRMSQYRLHFPNSEAGSKLDAWAWYGSKKMSVKENVVPPGCYDVFFTQPSHRASMGDNSLLNCAMRAGKNKIIMVRDELWKELHALLNIVSNKNISIRPTTGMTALAMALDFQPKLVTIVGFDATLPNRPGWGDAKEVEKWRVEAPHDMVAEKILITELFYHGMWLGKHIPDLEVNWIRLD